MKLMIGNLKQIIKNHDDGLFGETQDFEIMVTEAKHILSELEGVTDVNNKALEMIDRFRCLLIDASSMMTALDFYDEYMEALQFLKDAGYKE